MTCQRGKSIVRSQKEKITVYVNWAEVIGIAAGLAFATFVGSSVLIGIIISIPIGFAERKILRNSAGQKLLTKEMVERELAIQYPQLYSIFIFIPAFGLSLGLVTFIVAILWQLAQRF